MSPIGRRAPRRLFSVPVLAGVGLVAGVMLAGVAMPSTSVRLRLAAHAFDTPQGTAMTYIRIREAARSVCGYAGRVFPEEQEGWDACVATTICFTVAKIGDPKLTELYFTRSRGSQSRSSEDCRAGLRLR